MRIGRNEPGEVEEYTDFIKEAEGLKSTCALPGLLRDGRRAQRSTPGGWLCLPG